MLDIVPDKNCYRKLKSQCTVRNQLLDFCLNDDDWINPWNITVKGTFFKKIAPRDIIFADAFLAELCSSDSVVDHKWTEEVTVANKGDFGANIFLLPPNTHYELHWDRNRKSSLNMLINSDLTGISYFQVSEPYNQHHIKITQLKYETDCFYMLNTKVPHAVTNLDTPRFMLSISLNREFDDMVELFKSKNQIID